MSETWRVGNHQPQNLYEGDRYAGVVFKPEDAARIVAAINGTPPRWPPANGDTPDSTTDRETPTPTALVAEIQDALIDAGLSIFEVAINVHMGGHPSASILFTGDGSYSRPQGSELARTLGLTGVSASEHQGSTGRIRTLRGETPSGVSITLHVEPEGSDV